MWLIDEVQLFQLFRTITTWSIIYLILYCMYYTHHSGNLRARAWCTSINRFIKEKWMKYLKGYCLTEKRPISTHASGHQLDIYISHTYFNNHKITVYRIQVISRYDIEPVHLEYIELKAGKFNIHSLCGSGEHYDINMGKVLAAVIIRHDVSYIRWIFSPSM